MREIFLTSALSIGGRRGYVWGFVRWMWLRDARGRRHRSVDAVGDAFEVLREGWRGTPEEGDIAPGVDASGDVFEVLRGGCG